jgi:phosphoglycolate phosphatase
VTINTIVFDLDGTLIDSSPSILLSIKAAFDELDIRPARELSRALVGPPLIEMLVSLTEGVDEAKLELLAQIYKQHYDEIGWRQTKVFAGIPVMLEQLRDASMDLYVATNKRLQPANMIIESLGWAKYFNGIYALDYYDPPLKRKSEMLERMAVDIPLVKGRCVYVGDRREDAEAAGVCEVPFIMVNWGYGGQCNGHFRQAITPSDILSAIVSIENNINI